MHAIMQRELSRFFIGSINYMLSFNKMILVLIVLMSGVNSMCAFPVAPNPFAYDLGVKVLSGNNNPEVTICCHGYGHSNQIVDTINLCNFFDHTVVGFNFPDYGITDACDHSNVAYGTIREILPLLHILKFYAYDQKIAKLNVYGFSAGGGAVINALAILNQYSYEEHLQKIGISKYIAESILNTLQDGMIILECPLKSVREILDYRGVTKNLSEIAANYEKNNMNPVDAIVLLSPLRLKILLYFEQPDEILSNRDDDLFIERLAIANNGTTLVTIGNHGGHNAYHAELWQGYKELVLK